MNAELSHLVSTITENTTKLAGYLSDNNLPQLSLDANGPLKSPIPPEAVDIESARVKAIDAAYQLQCVLLGPQEHLMNMANNELVSLHAISKLKIARAVSVGEEVTFAQVSERCGLNEADTRRILRHASVRNIFTEPRPGIVAHNAVSRLLLEDDKMSDWAYTVTHELWPAATQTVNAMVKYPGSEEPNETGFSLAHNTHDSMFEYLSKSPERARRFGNGMALYAQSPGLDRRHVVEGYDWSGLGSATVVDLGGAHGDVCKALAAEYPRLQFIIQDLPPTVASAPPLDDHLAPRFQYMAHDFFTEQVVKDADVYLFRQTLHNWGDKHCVQILQSLVPALKPGARVIINDNVLPPPGKLPRLKELRIRTMDITMTQLLNAKERELGEWQEMFEQADWRFEFLGGKQPAGSLLWIIEARWSP